MKELHEEYNDENLSPKYIKSPVNFVFNQDRGTPLRKSNHEKYLNPHTRLSSAAEASLVNPRAHNKLQNSRYSRPSSRHGKNVKYQEVPSKSDYRVQEFLNREVPSFKEDSNNLIYKNDAKFPNSNKNNRMLK